MMNFSELMLMMLLWKAQLRNNVLTEKKRPLNRAAFFYLLLICCNAFCMVSSIPVIV